MGDEFEQLTIKMRRLLIIARSSRNNNTVLPVAVHKPMSSSRFTGHRCGRTVLTFVQHCEIEMHDK